MVCVESGLTHLFFCLFVLFKENTRLGNSRLGLDSLPDLTEGLGHRSYVNTGNVTYHAYYNLSCGICLNH